MRQRNAGPYPVILPTLDPPVQVEPDGVIDHPDPLAGFEPVVDKPVKKTTKGADAPASTEGA